MQTQTALRLAVVCSLLVSASFPLWAEDFITQSVPREAIYYTDLQRCYQLGLLTGYEDGSYRPDSILTRAELWVAFNRLVDIMRLQGCSLQGDLPPIYGTYARGVRDHWGMMAFERLLRLGLIDRPPMPAVRGFDEGIERLEFAQLAVATMRAYGVLAPDLRPAELAVGDDIMPRQPDGSYQMHQGMPRWEFAVAMHRLVNKLFPVR